MSTDKQKPAPVIHIKVTVTTVVNPKTGATEYQAKYDPEIIKVKDNDTILSFKLQPPTPDDVRVISVKTRPEDNTQLSTPSISKNGKHVTLTDINTEKETLNLDFRFGSTKTNARLAMACEDDEGDMYPEVDNDPPR